MHYFYGNSFTGCWMYCTPDGVWHSWTPKDIQGRTIKAGEKDLPIVWQRTDKSGDFFWPHIQEDGKLMELMYEDG